MLNLIVLTLLGLFLLTATISLTYLAISKTLNDYHQNKLANNLNKINTFYKGKALNKEVL